MGVKTRAKPVAGKRKDETAVLTKPTVKKLDASVDNPPQVFVLPKDVSAEARIVTIPHPATGTPSRYLACPERGLYEFTRVAAPKKQHRSWLLASDRRGEQQEVAGENTDNSNDGAGYVLKTPDMFVATPVDPLFLLLPSLAADPENIGQEYLAPSDYTAMLANSSLHLAEVMQADRNRRLQALMEPRVEAVCDCMDMGDDKMYALSLPKLVQDLVSKARRMVVKGLPASMEDHFVRQALEVPVLSIKREESSVSIAPDDAEAGAENKPASDLESQETDASGTTTTASTAATSVSIAQAPEAEAESSPEAVINLLRLRVALNFLLTSYISAPLRAKLDEFITRNSATVDFGLLDKHLEHIASLKKQAQALRSLSDNISRKRSAVDDDEDAMEKAEAKKRKKEEEENRKKNVSHGVKKLMKANTSGMKKLSSFFGKK